jgi:catechol 2,3-dioxygenase-like lactoylglutathione lyase family enzyme
MGGPGRTTVSVDGIDYIYLETRDWERSVEFWQGLGFAVVLDLGTAGRLEPPGGGPGIFLQEASAETPLAAGVYLRVTDPEFSPPMPVVTGPLTSHWGSRLMTVRDPDGREFVLQWPEGTAE